MQKIVEGPDVIDRVSLRRGGRIDIVSQDFKFELLEVKSGGTINQKHSYAYWLPANNQEKHCILEGDVGFCWENMWIEFTAAASGCILINIRGSFYDDIKTYHHDVWVDDCEVSGTQIKNGGFEMIDLEGKPAYWGWKGIKQRYSIDGSEAHSGQCCVLVWHDIPLVQRIEVEEGKRYRVSAWFKSYQG